MRSIFFLAPLILLTSCSYLNQKLGLKDDNWIEESVEAVIDYKLNIDVDLTPESPE